MFQCTETPIDQCFERYSQGTLPEPEAQKFEEHYFDCPECLAQVEALQAVAKRLGNHPWTRATRPIPWPMRVGALAAMAAMLILGFWGIKSIHRTTGSTVANNPAVQVPQLCPSPQPGLTSQAPSALSRLADLTLPAFQLPNLRAKAATLTSPPG